MLKLTDDHDGNVLEFEEVRKGMWSPMHTYILPPDTSTGLETVDLGQVRHVEGYQPKGYSRRDTMESADLQQHGIIEMCCRFGSFMARSPIVEHDASGTVTLQTIGTITARLSTPVEILMQTCFQMLPVSRPAELTGRCQALDKVNRDTKTEDVPQTQRQSRKKQSIAGRVFHLVSIICRIVQTLFVGLSDALARGVAFAHDQGVPLLGRVTKFCMEKCGQLRDAAQDGLSEIKQSGPLAFIEKGCKRLVAWMRNLFSY